MKFTILKLCSKKNGKFIWYSKDVIKNNIFKNSKSWKWKDSKLIKIIKLTRRWFWIKNEEIADKIIYLLENLMSYCFD